MKPFHSHPVRGGRHFRWSGLSLVAAFVAMSTLGAHARSWTSPDGSKTFEAEIKSYAPASGMVSVSLPNGMEMVFKQDKLSAADLSFLQEKAATGTPLPSPESATTSAPGVEVETGNHFAKHDGKRADMSKPVQVFIFLVQSNMVGHGKATGGDGSLDFAVMSKKKYPYLVGEDGSWVERTDLRYVQYMQGKGQMRNEWMRLGSQAEVYMDVGEAMSTAMVKLLAFK